MIRSVVLDIDETLVLTEAASYALENAVLAHLGRPPIDRDLHRANWGLPLREAIAIRSPGVDLAAFLAAFEPEFAAWIAQRRIDVVTAENLATLDELIGAGRSIHLLTSRTGDEIAHLVHDDHPLSGRLTASYHLDNIRYGKPDPRAFDEFLADNGARPDECVYVGDSVGDARAATGAGIRFIACMEGGLRRRADFDAYPVAAFINTFTALPGVLAALDGAEP